MGGIPPSVPYTIDRASAQLQGWKEKDFFLPGKDLEEVALYSRIPFFEVAEKPMTSRFHKACKGEQLYELDMTRANPLTANNIISGGGQTGPISPAMTETVRSSSMSTRKLARILATVDWAMEILMVLADEGPLDLAALSEEEVPPDIIARVVSSLQQSHLVHLTENRVALTLQGANLITRLRANVSGRG
jgi:hypothetical protein